MLLVVVLIATGAFGAGTSTPEPGSTKPAAAHASAAVAATAARQTAPPAAGTDAPAPARPARADPGSLPQTDARPSSRDAAFAARMAKLWRGVLRDSSHDALPAFFPEKAYMQVKAIGAPAADWTYRLVHDYALDLGAAHRLLGGAAARARLTGVRAVASYAHWVPPGVCYNAVGYWELPNARVVYRQGGQERSFGIASMISWRGQWYVVHLGAVEREGEDGVLDEPASGPGTSADSGTC